MILTHLPAAFRKSARSDRFHLPNLVLIPQILREKAAKYSVINPKPSSYRAILSMIFLWMRYLRFWARIYILIGKL